MKRRNIELVMTITLILAALLLSKNTVHLVSNSKAEPKKRVVVIDPGHGNSLKPKL